MIIHFSVLAVILVCALIWERPIRYHKLNSIYYGERYDYKSPLMPWLIVFGYIAYLAAMRSGEVEVPAGCSVTCRRSTAPPATTA